MAQRILALSGEAILSTEDDVICPLDYNARVYLPLVGDGLNGTVEPGWTCTITSTNIGSLEVLRNRGNHLTTIEGRASKLFVAVRAAGHQMWSEMDVPLAYPADRITGLDPGGGGPHAASHQNGGADEISIAGLSGLAGDSQTPLAHSHVIADTTGLQTTLDGKADDAHSHVIADTTGLQGALDAKAPTSHTHAIGDTTGLQAALDGKATAAHTHAQSDVSGLVAALDAKSDDGHAHAASEITSGVLAAARIATGTPDGTKFLRDDQTWQPAGGGGAHAPTHQNGGADEISVAGLSGLLADGQTPLAHAASHLSGGADTIKLDDLAAPDDNTDLDASTTKHGLLKKLPGGTTDFLRADGAFAAPPGGGSLSYQEADRATDLALSTTYTAAASLSLAAGTWLVFGQSSIESTSTTQGNVSVRLRDTTNSVTYSIAEGEVDSALPDRCNLAVHAVIVLAGTATIALEGRQSAGTSHMIGPGNLGDTGTKVTRITAIKIA